MAAVSVLQEAERQFQEEKLNVQLVDQVVNIMNRGSGAEQRQANVILVRLKEDPNSWTKVDAILQYSELIESKYFALQVLESVIQTRWKSLPAEQRDGIRGFIVQLILQLSSTPETLDNNAVLLHKLNLVLVQIVKQDWPKNWPSFITDIVTSSNSNVNICVNNMNILSLLSEEVFDFGAQNLTQSKELYLKKEFCGQFQDVFQLCIDILDKCPSNQMVHSTLKTMQRFLTWIPVGYIFETNVTELLATKFLSLEVYRVVTLQCLTEIASVRIAEGSEVYYLKLKEMFYLTIREIRTLLNNSSPDLAAAYKNGTDQDQRFISCLAQFLCIFLKEHALLVEVPMDSADTHSLDMHTYAMVLLVALSRVEDIEVFKICLDFWCFITSDLYRESPFCVYMQNGPAENKRKQIYRRHLAELRYIMIGRMAKPEEVLVVENDQGEVVREVVKDTDSITLYRNMREALVYLTHLDKLDTEMKMLQKLSAQVDGSEFSWKSLNCLCWAIGSISGTMTEEDEKRFLVGVIRDLLGMVEQRRGKDNKAVIASNIMYVVGQYPRFLRAHWKFLKTVINKLFEFMHESHDGVQDMACDTFIKITMKTKRHFVIIQPHEGRPFIDEIIENLPATICDLTPAQSHVFFEAVGQIMSAQTEPEQLDSLIKGCMAFPNNKWDMVIAMAQENVTNLGSLEVLREVVNILKTNVAVCKAVGAPFVSQLSRIYSDLLSVYRILSSELSKIVASRGEDAIKDPLLKQMRVVKREFLILLSTWVAQCKDKELIMESIVPPLFEAVLLDYRDNVPGAREPKVLSLLSIIVVQLGADISSHLDNILGAVFECTLAMINKDMEGWPEHRTNFFQLVLSLVDAAFLDFLKMPQDGFQVVIDAVVWAFQHSMRNVAEIGLDILKSMLTQAADLNNDFSQQFYKTFYMSIMQHVLAIVADSSQVHVAGINYYADILCVLFSAPEYTIKVPLNDSNPEQSNVDYIYSYIGEIFTQHFSNLSQDQIRVIVKGFFSYNRDSGAMKNHLRDFLIQIKEFIGEDSSDLFLEDREREIQEAQAKKNAVPGMLKPDEIVDGEADMI